MWNILFVSTDVASRIAIKKPMLDWRLRGFGKQINKSVCVWERERERSQLKSEKYKNKIKILYACPVSADVLSQNGLQTKHMKLSSAKEAAK